MIPDVISILYLAIPWVALIYIFRGISSDSNPLLGNLAASGFAFIVAALCVTWLAQGSIVSPSIVPNSSYALGSGVSIADALNSSESNVLGPGGSGMFQSAAMSSLNGTNDTQITVFTHSIVYSGFYNVGLMFLYALLTVISLGLFCVFIYQTYQVVTAPEPGPEEGGY